MGNESEFAILKVLELHGSLSLPKINEFSLISELECSSTQSNLITLGYVFKVGERFSLPFLGKKHLTDS